MLDGALVFFGRIIGINNHKVTMINAVGASPVPPQNPVATPKPVVPASPVTPPAAASVPPTVTPPTSEPKQPPSDSLKPKKKAGLSPKIIAGIALLFLLLLGGGASLLLTQTNQDVRQQASTGGAIVYPTPTPGGALPSCGGQPASPSCNGLGGSCGGYESCHQGSGYDACDPIAGTNTCIYSLSNGTRCTAQCPDSMQGTGLSRCHCSNGVWTIGRIPPGGSCDTLCRCTNNDCPGCSDPTRPPTRPTNPADPTPTPTTPPAGPQCASIELLDVSGNPITGAGDSRLRTGDAIKFRCGATGTVHHFEFRVIGFGGSRTLAATGNISETFTIPGPSGYRAQCRVCTSPTECHSYEN